MEVGAQRLNEENDDDMVFESAADTLARQDAARSRVVCRRVCLAVCLVFIVGILIGGAGQRRYGSQVDRLSLDTQRDFGSVLDNGVGADACESFKGMAGTFATAALSERDVTGLAASFVAQVKQLSVGSTAVSQEPTVREALLSGLAVGNVRVDRRFVRDGTGAVRRPIVVDTLAEHDSAHHTSLPIECGACTDTTETLPPVTAVSPACQASLVDAIRSMLGCGCCGGPAAHLCRGSPAVVLQPERVCASLPLTVSDAAAALHAQSVAVQRSVRWLTPPDIVRLAATFWPHDVVVAAPTTREERRARRVVAAVAAAAAAMGFAGLTNATVHIGWSATHLPPGPATLPEHQTVDDLVLGLTRYRATAQFLSQGSLMRWPEDPSTPGVTFAETEQALYVPNHYLRATPLLPSYGEGALARSVAAAIAHKTSPRCASDTRADMIARLVGAAVAELEPAFKGPTIYTNDTFDIGPLQLYYMGAAASDSSGCRIGHVPDRAFAKTFECKVAAECN